LVPCIPCGPIKNDGRICPSCECKDTDPDPADATKTRVWDKSGVRLACGLNKGLYCWYCWRVFLAAIRLALSS
jgi:hypothetical protein